MTCQSAANRPPTIQGGRTATANTWRDANGFISNIEQHDGVVDNRYTGRSRESCS
jgi:hypothetical protein